MSSTERSRRSRERRRQALEAADAAEFRLRPAGDLLGPAVAETIAALDLEPEHAAAAKLAERYAVTIDRARDQAHAMRWLAPLLLDALEALHATPLSRARVKGPVKQDPNRKNWLEELRMARRTDLRP